MPEWLIEHGIGETRAALVEDGEIVEAIVELTDELRAGSIVSGRLADVSPERTRGWVETPCGAVLIQPVPRAITNGSKVTVEIIRQDIGEPRSSKAMIGRLTDEPECEGPSLAAKIGEHVVVTAHGMDRLEAAGWHDLIDEAISGDISFDGGELKLSLTPAMTLFDVDGDLPATELAISGAAAAGRAIRRHGIGGSIGIDFPTVPSKSHRQRAAEALDAALPQPFERTSVNGFGFLQVVRKRERRSIPEIMQYSAVQAAARALLRRAEGVPGAGARLLIASPAVVRYLESREDWLDELRRRIGTEVRLDARESFTTWGFHVQSVQS